MTTTEQLIAAIDRLSAMAAQADTEQKRINAANRLDGLKVALGPSWVDFATFRFEGGRQERSFSAEQFAAYLGAKRAFAMALGIAE